MATTNIVIAPFGGSRSVTVRPLYQYDYGQILRFDGLDLPQSYEVHFSDKPYSGEATTQIGDADGVTIPDSLLENSGNIYAWVYLHTGAGDGETRYTAKIPVKARPTPETLNPSTAQQNAIEEAINALNAADGVAELFADVADERSKDAEAWAVGRRNNVPVPPGDETFRNNARYYSDLAQQAMQESGYITGALNEDGELVIEVVGITGMDVRVQNEEVVVIYE